MPVKKKKSNSIIFTEIIRKYLKAFIIGIIFTLGGSVLSALVYYKLNTNMMLIYCIPYIFIAFGAFLTGYISQNKIKKRGITVGLIAIIPILVITLIFNLIIGNGKISVFYLIVPAVQLLLSAAGGVLAANLKKIY